MGAAGITPIIVAEVYALLTAALLMLFRPRTRPALGAGPLSHRRRLADRICRGL
jgi:hypothetical protein